jgi:2-isopropylmalate synthase
MTATTPESANESATPRAERDRVIVFDTTMRDGEQSPGASMSLEE